MNLVLNGEVRHLESGLNRLKTLAEQLPNVNFEGLDPQFDTIEPRNFVYAVVETSSVDLDEINRAENLAIGQAHR
ncbi:MAG: hypothetical protein R3C16_04085 [Hyphomonadaceae bacterium]